MIIDIEQYDYFLIVDLEATCCDQGSIRSHEMEIIEIGAVILEAKSLNIIDEFSIFIKPSRHPTLTPFCTALTTITQQNVDSALSYPQAIQNFKKWLYQYSNFLFCSWGNYDKFQLQQDSQLHQLPFPIGAPHINLKTLFSATQKLDKKYGMAEALKVANLALQGTHHRGIDDAKNMTALMPYILGLKQLPNHTASNIEKIKYVTTLSVLSITF